jgi:hypothetical protein
MECVSIEEDDKQDREYMSVPDVPTVNRHRGCPHCACQRYMCTHITNQNLKLEVEFIGMPRLWDGKISYESDLTPAVNYTNYKEPSTFQEYLLWYYFPHKGFPDLWIILPPIHYNELSVQSAISDLQQFVSAFEERVPQSTQLVLLSHLRFCFDPANDWAPQVFNLDQNEVYHALNQLIYDAFGSLLASNRVASFLDLMNVLCPFSCNWNHGAAHYTSDFYSFLIDHVFSLMCA